MRVARKIANIEKTDVRQSDVRPEACGASFQTIRTQNICMLSYALTYSNQLSTSRRLDLRQRLVSNACKSLVFHIWQAGATTRDCCCGIQVICFRNS